MYFFLNFTFGFLVSIFDCALIQNFRTPSLPLSFTCSEAAFSAMLETSQRLWDSSHTVPKNVNFLGTRLHPFWKWSPPFWDWHIWTNVGHFQGWLSTRWSAYELFHFEIFFLYFYGFFFFVACNFYCSYFRLRLIRCHLSNLHLPHICGQHRNYIFHEIPRCSKEDPKDPVCLTNPNSRKNHSRPQPRYCYTSSGCILHDAG